MSTAGPLRQPIPVGRSILWSPARGGPKRPGNIPFPVFLSQAALTAIHEHVATPHRPGQGILGFLLGDQCECPETNVSYLVIDVALRLNQAIYGDRTRDVVTRLWDHIQQQLEQQRASLIGWYHTHPPLPLTLSGHDAQTHEHYFAQPGQAALVVGADPAGAARARGGAGETKCPAGGKNPPPPPPPPPPPGGWRPPPPPPPPPRLCPLRRHGRRCRHGRHPSPSRSRSQTLSRRPGLRRLTKLRETKLGSTGRSGRTSSRIATYRSTPRSPRRARPRRRGRAAGAGCPRR